MTAAIGATARREGRFMRHVRAIVRRSPKVVMVIAIVVAMLSLGSGAYAAGLLDGHQIRPVSLAADQIAARSINPQQPRASSFTWHRLTLLNGFRSYSSSFFGVPAYAISNGVLYLRGVVAGPRVIPDPEFARLPAGARPANNLYIICYNFGGAGSNLTDHISISPNGDMAVISGSGLPVTPSLAAISFPLSS